MPYYNLLISAIHGTTFFRSGRKAFKLLVNNSKNVIAINSIGDFVLFLTKVLIIIIPIAIGYAMLRVEIFFSILFQFLIKILLFRIKTTLT